MPTRRSLQATRPSASTSDLEPGARKRTLTLAFASSGLVVRMAMPPRLRLSARAAAIVLPNRVLDGNAQHDPGTAAPVEVVREEMGCQGRQDMLGRAVFVHVARDAEGRQIAHFAGIGNRPAEHQNRQTASIELPDRANQIEAGCTREPQIQHHEIDAGQIAAHARQQLGRGFDGNRLVSGVLEGRLEAVPHERGVVCDEDCLRADRRGTCHGQNCIGSCHSTYRSVAIEALGRVADLRTESL